MVIDLTPLWKLFSRILQVDWLEYGRRVLNTHDSRGPRSVGTHVIDRETYSQYNHATSTILIWMGDYACTLICMDDLGLY